MAPLSSAARRLDRLEDRYRPYVENPARIPNWMRSWINPLSDADLEILENAGWADGADGDPERLSPENRERYYELVASWERFCERRPS